MSKVLDFMDHIEDRMVKELPGVAPWFRGEHVDLEGRTFLIYGLDYMALNPFRFQQRRARQAIDYFVRRTPGCTMEERVGFVVVQIPER